MDVVVIKEGAPLTTFERLGLSVPSGMALLPRNFDSSASTEQLFHESSVPDIRKAWRTDAVAEESIDEAIGAEIPEISENFVDFITPIIFVGQYAWQHHAALITGITSIINLVSAARKFSSKESSADVSIVIRVAKDDNSAAADIRITAKGGEPIDEARLVDVVTRALR
jgi:hypothetical protein